MRLTLGVLVLITVLVISFSVPLTPNHHAYMGASNIVLAGAEESADNGRPLLKLIYPCWDVWSSDIIGVVVKAYDPDGLLNISAGVPNQYMVPLTPKEYGNTTLYETGVDGNIIFHYYGTLLGHRPESANITVMAVDTLGNTAMLSFTLHWPDRTDPPVIIATPRNGTHYVWGESFYFTGGFPVNYWPCPEGSTFGNGTTTNASCTFTGSLNWTVNIALDNTSLITYSGGGGGGGWLSGTYEAPHVETVDLEPGVHNFSYSIRFMPVNVAFKSVSVFYVEDPGTPTVYKVLNKQDKVITLEEPSITITAPHLTAPAKVWVYTDTSNPGSPPPYAVITGPILIVSNSTSRPGILNIYFHLDPEKLREMGITMQDLVPLAWDRDLDIWYPRGVYKIYRDNHTVKMQTQYPLYGGGLYIALTSKALPITPPRITILSPQDGATLHGEDVTIEWAIENGTAEITGITLTIDGQHTISLPPTSSSYTLKLQPGTHEIILQVTDESGLYDTETLTITVTGQSDQNTGTTTGTGHKNLIVGATIAAVAAIVIASLKLGLISLPAHGLR